MGLERMRRLARYRVDLRNSIPCFFQARLEESKKNADDNRLVTREKQKTFLYFVFIQHTLYSKKNLYEISKNQLNISNIIKVPPK